MVTYLSFMKNKEENEWLKKQIQFQAARWTEEQWRYYLFEELKRIKSYLYTEKPPDVVSWDVTSEDALNELMGERRKFNQAFLMIVADASISPVRYLRPGVFPSALILKPFDSEEVSHILSDAIEVFSERYQKNQEDNAFLIETREGKIHIPYDQIKYIEAREKKLYIRRGMEEYGFYQTLEQMEKQLPGNFKRCHRSYIVNMDKVEKIRFSEGIIELSSGEEVFLSKSLKKSIRDYQKNGGKNGAQILSKNQ